MRVTNDAQTEDIEQLRKELANARVVIVELRALVADRDAKIASLTADVAALQKAVATLMGQRRGGVCVPKGQGLLFATGEQAAAAPEAPAGDLPAGVAATSTADGSSKQAVAPVATPRATCTKRKPGKIDTTGLPRKQQVHELPVVSPSIEAFLRPVAAPRAECRKLRARLARSVQGAKKRLDGRFNEPAGLTFHDDVTCATDVGHDRRQTG